MENEETTYVCECCGYEFTEEWKVKEYSGKPLTDEKVTQCEICASSLIGNNWIYRKHEPEMEIQCAMAWLTNRILEAIENKERSAVEELVNHMKL